MKTRVIFVERKPSDSVSIERVFRQIAKDLPDDQFDVEFQSVPYGNGILAIFKNLFFFRPRPADIYHITGDIHYIAMVLPKEKTVLTVHDLVFLHRRSGLRRYILKKLFLNLPLQRLGRVTTVSQAVKDEIVQESGVESSIINIIENPLIEGFVSGVVKPFEPSCPVILHIGTAENKNLDNLVGAVQGINCKLRIIGRISDKIFQRLKVNQTRYENVAGLDENEIVKEYRDADIVSFCSTYEGFGLPIIEAQAMRKPVITSDLAPMNDVAGCGAALVDPFDVAGIKAGLLRLINEPEYRNALVASGAENIKRYDRQTVAARYTRVYRQLQADQNSR